MIKKSIKTIQEEVVDDIICNKCGCSLKEGDGFVEDFYGLTEVTVTGGYFSKQLDDGSSYSFSLCEACLSEMFSTFKVPVDIQE
jgi:hypothetical protein